MLKLLGQCRVLIAAALATVSGWLFAGTPFPEVTRSRLADYFRPDQVSRFALSPDGTRLAYVMQLEKAVSIVVREVDRPERRETVFADVDRPGNSFSRVSGNVQVRFLRWAESGALVYHVSLPTQGEQRYNDELHVIDPDGRNRCLLKSADIETVRYLGANLSSAFDAPRTMRCLGFSASAPGAVLVLVSGGDVAPVAVIRVDIGTGAHKEIDEYETGVKAACDADGNIRCIETPRFRRPRGTPPFSTGSPGSQRQRYEFRNARGRWQPLDSLSGPNASLGFSFEQAEFFASRSLPLGFGADPNLLYYTSNVGRDTFGLFTLNLTSGERRELSVDGGRFDVGGFTEAFDPRRLVMDRAQRVVGAQTSGPEAHVVWFDPELAALQLKVNHAFPERTVRLVDWDKARARIILEVEGHSDPGRHFIYHRGAMPRFVEVARRRPELTYDRVAPVATFAIPGSGGGIISGQITTPRFSRVTPPPLVVICPDAPMASARFGFVRESQALAAFGFMVVEVNYRGVMGVGTRHRDGILAGVDRLPIEDIRAVLDWMKREHPYDVRRVALLGDAFGGYIALRALELHPKVFRCAVVINAPVDTAAWLGEAITYVPGRPSSPKNMTPLTTFRIPFSFAEIRNAFFDRAPSSFKGISVLDGIENLTQPLFIVVDEARSVSAAESAVKLRDALEKRDRPPRTVQLSAKGDRDELAPGLYLRIGSFLNDAFFEYRVEVGNEKEVE